MKQLLKNRVSYFCLIMLVVIKAVMADRVIDQQEIKDLELFQGINKQHGGLFDILNATTTNSGKKILENIMQNPVTQVDILHKRQNVIRYLFEHQEVLQKLCLELGIVGKHETSLFFKQTSLEAASLEPLYFTSSMLKPLNTNSTALIGRQLVDVAVLALPTLEHLALHYLVNATWKEKIGASCGHNHDKHYHHHHDNAYHHHKDDCHTCEHDHTFDDMLRNMYNVVHTGVHVVGLWGLYKDLVKKVDIIKEMQKPLINARHAVLAMQNIIEQLDNDPDLQQVFIDSIDLNIQQARNNIALLIQLIDKSAFYEHASTVQHSGVILATYRKIVDMQSEIESIMHVIGTIDAYVSLVSTFANMQQESKSCCFVDYDESSKHPYISLVNARHPLILDAYSPLTFDIGRNVGAQNAIITGNNMAGKSTTLKTVAISVLMAQTCGFVAAEQMVLTPFVVVQTSLNLADDIAAGASGFATELLRADAMLSKIDENKDKGFVFVAIDELFVGSSVDNNSRVLERFMGALGNNLHVVSVCATHYAQVTRLAQDFPEQFDHYSACCQEGIDEEKQYILTRCALHNSTEIQYDETGYPKLDHHQILLGH